MFARTFPKILVLGIALSLPSLNHAQEAEASKAPAAIGNHSSAGAMPSHPASVKVPSASSKSTATPVTQSNAGKTAVSGKVLSPDGKPLSDKDGKPVVVRHSGVGPAVAKKNSLALLPLQSTDWHAGCGCRFFKPTDQKDHGPLLLRLNDKKQAAIRAEGTLETMKLVDERHVLRKPPAIMARDRMMLKFKGNSTTASFSGSAERNCAKFQDSCKAITYQGVLSLSQTGKQASFPVWGTCGCQ